MTPARWKAAPAVGIVVVVAAAADASVVAGASALVVAAAVAAVAAAAVAAVAAAADAAAVVVAAAAALVVGSAAGEREPPAWQWVAQPLAMVVPPLVSAGALLCKHRGGVAPRASATGAQQNTRPIV